MQHGTHVVVVGLDVAHGGLDIRVVEQALREVDVPLGCLHQVGGQGVPETVRGHSHPNLLGQLPVHGFDLVGVHHLALVVRREPVDVEQLVVIGESGSIGLLQEPR